MKQFFLILSLAITALLNSSKAQSLLMGMTPNGGEGAGVIFGLPAGSTSYTQQYNWPVVNPGINPQYNQLCQAANGKLYGTTTSGGVSNFGILFEYDLVTATYTKKLDFTGVGNGSYPIGSLMGASNGKLYGVTANGGANDLGVLFEYDPNTDTYSKKLDFNGTTNGSTPYCKLIQAANGKLYGMTRDGGINGMGVLFEYDPTTATYTKKLDFSGTGNGSFPDGSLMQAANGKIYGMTKDGGASNNGVLFEYDPSTATYTKKLDFNGTGNGSKPYGSLMQAANGKLYGVTRDGGSSNNGVLFEYEPTTSTYTKKFDFNGAVNGSKPFGNLIQVANGKLYGMTGQGGTNQDGVLFEYDPSTATYTKKMDFNEVASGSFPIGSLMQATNGKLYGFTTRGGAYNNGVLFEYDHSTATYTKKMDFNITSNGSYPYGSLMQAVNGKMYGMTYNGGANNLGVLFEYDPSTTICTKKLDFNGTANGSNPYGSLMQATNGKLYGMTRNGGANNQGTLFEYDPSTAIYTKKVDFNGTANGSHPYGSLIQASNGKLYGMTADGGVNSNGVLFEFDPTTSTYTKKLDFNSATTGSYPYGSLVQAANGKLYGMTQQGGTNNLGLLFEFDPTTATYTKKLDFNGTSNGSKPHGSLMQAANGKFYGMTREGGTNGKGVLFEYDLSTSAYAKKLDFNGTVNGSSPYGSLMQAANGKLYGMTTVGGTNNQGTLFEYDLNTATYTKKLDYNGTNGSRPQFSNILETCVTSAPSGSLTQSFCGTATVGNLTATGTGIKWHSSSVSTISLTAATALVNGSHYFATQTNGCESATRLEVTVILNALPAVSVTSGTICSGNSFTLSPTGAVSFIYSSGSNVVSPITTANYTVTGEDAQGCTNTAVSTVTVYLLPSVTAITSSSLICTQQTATLSALGANSYTWNNTFSGTNIAITPSVTTTYTVVGVDLNGCENSAVITQSVSTCTSVKQINNKSDYIMVFPNPNNGAFTIEIVTASAIVITNVMSEIILTQNLQIGKNEIDLKHLANGMYFIHTDVNSYKIIKQ